MSAGPHRWGRSEKYHVRPRHLYALVFPNGCVYIGQTVNLKTREAQHRAHGGGWNRPFEFLPLSTVEGTKADVEHHEIAWRYLASRHGWGVYAKPPGILIRRHGALMNRQARAALRTMRWPVGSRGMAPMRRWIGWAVLVRKWRTATGTATQSWLLR